MEVDFAFLADAAEAANGKVHVVGGAFDTIWTEQVPITHPRLSFVLRLVFTASELDREHYVEIRILDEDGGSVANAGGDLKVQRNPNLPMGWKQPFLTVLNFSSLPFKKFGDYSFDVVINNNSCKSIPLRLAQRIKI